MALTGDPMATAGSIVRESTEREALEHLSDGEILRRAVIERGAGEGARPRSAALWLKFPGNLQIACKLIGSPAATCLRQGFGTPSAALTEFSHARAVTPAVVQPAACCRDASGPVGTVPRTQFSEVNMTDLTIRTLEASTKKIPQDTLSALRGKVRGTVALPGEDGYEAARRIWNGMVDRRPGLRGSLLGAADVINAVKLARDEKLLVAVRGGGHNIAGNAVCDGGLLIDQSLMRSVHVDPVSGTASLRPRQPVPHEPAR